MTNKTNGSGRKPDERKLKRRIAINKLLTQYPTITPTDMLDKLQQVFGISISRQSLHRDMQWLKDNDINEFIGDSSKTLLEVDRDELSYQLENTRLMQEQAKSEGNTKDYLYATRLIKDIITTRANIDKSIMELEMSEKAEDRPIINLTIGMPKTYESPKKKRAKTA